MHFKRNILLLTLLFSSYLLFSQSQTKLLLGKNEFQFGKTAYYFGDEPLQFGKWNPRIRLFGGAGVHFESFAAYTRYFGKRLAVRLSFEIYLSSCYVCDWPESIFKPRGTLEIRNVDQYNLTFMYSVLSGERFSLRPQFLVGYRWGGESRIVFDVLRREGWREGLSEGWLYNDYGLGGGLVLHTYFWKGLSLAVEGHFIYYRWQDDKRPNPRQQGVGIYLGYRF